MIPEAVGITKDSKVHLTLRVSFPIVQRVVAQGKCISEKSMTHIAVINVQPLDISKSFSSYKLSSSIIEPFDI